MIDQRRAARFESWAADKTLWAPPEGRGEQKSTYPVRDSNPQPSD